MEDTMNMKLYVFRCQELGTKVIKALDIESADANYISKISDRVAPKKIAAHFIGYFKGGEPGKWVGMICANTRRRRDDYTYYFYDVEELEYEEE